jgi:hypothetical protein
VPLYLLHLKLLIITLRRTVQGTGYGEDQPIGMPVRVGHWEQTVWVQDGGLGLASQAVVEGTLMKIVGKNWRAL